MNFLKGCLIFFSLSFSSLSLQAGDLGEKLGNLFNTDTSTEILRPEIAFQFFPEAYADNRMLVSWQIEPGYYLYRDKLNFSSNDERVVFADFQLPAGKVKADPVFGQVEVYLKGNQAVVPLVTDTVLPTVFEITIAFQGCKEDAVCYPPLEQSYQVNVRSGPAPVPDKPSLDTTTKLSEQDAITRALEDKGILINIVSFLGFGFLLALTPCVFPMIPILSGIIVGQAERITRARAFFLSLIYVLAMALTYALLGVIAGLFSINLQAASQNPWVLGVFSMVFVLLALSMFGFYELQLPASWQTKLLSGRQGNNRTTYTGAAIMGVLSAIIVGPCVAPPLAGALLYISQTGDALLGGLALFAMGLGFGIPLLVVGASSGELLPRAGSWMTSIKHAFGVIMLGVAIWFLERILPNAVVLILWALLFTGTAVFMGAFEKITTESTAWKKLKKALALVLLVYGIVLVVAAAYGNGTVLKPFRSLNTNQTGMAVKALPFEQVSSLDELNTVLLDAKEKQQIVMFDFYADWCITCVELEEYTFPEASVQTALKSLRLVQVDVTANNEAHKALLEKFELFGPPAILFFKETEELRSHRLIGFIKADEFVKHVEQIKQL